MAYFRCGSGGSSATPITPSNSSPVALTANTPVNPTASGYAIESYHDETPTAGEVHVWSAGNILKINSNTACIIDHFPPPDPTSITPSNSSPASMTSGNVYQPTANGYAIASYQSKTPSASGVSFNSGFVKMSSSGYAYSAQPTLKATTLYTNSSPSTSVTSGTITLSQDIDNFDYIEIQCVVGTGSTSSYIYSGTFWVSDWKSMTSDSGRYAVVNYTTSTYRFDRMFYYNSDTSVGYTTCHRHNASTSSAQNAYIIPYKVYGYKISA